jgi:hypothetical protein
MARIDPNELADDGNEPDVESIDVPPRRDQDAVAALRDTEAEAGEEQGVDDTFDLDDKEARELGVDLDNRDEPEPRLD